MQFVATHTTVESKNLFHYSLYSLLRFNYMYEAVISAVMIFDSCISWVHIKLPPWVLCVCVCVLLWFDSGLCAC
jgi:hypothetical protein